jgi:membrane associated rhomboid family serine protease
MKISAVMVLIAANVAVYLVEGRPDGPVTTLFALQPLHDADGQSYFYFWQIVTYAFLHDPRNLSHIGFNMLGLYMFGAEIERYAGPWRLLACYFASVITAGLAQLLVPPLLGAPPAPALGASGGVFGLFATLYAGAELLFGVTGTLSGIAHFAHLGGMIGSALVVLQWRRRARAAR